MLENLLVPASYFCYASSAGDLKLGQMFGTDKDIKSKDNAML